MQGVTPSEPENGGVKQVTAPPNLTAQKMPRLNATSSKSLPGARPFGIRVQRLPSSSTPAVRPSNTHDAETNDSATCFMLPVVSEGFWRAINSEPPPNRAHTP